MTRLFCKYAAVLLGLLTWASAASAGTLLVGNFNADTVSRFDAGTGAFLGTFAGGGPLSGPTGLTFGPDGHLHVTSFGENQVKRFDGATGAFLGDFTSGGGLDGPVFLTFSPDAAAVPEPGALALAVAGVAAMVGVGLRRARR